METFWIDGGYECLSSNKMGHKVGLSYGSAERSFQKVMAILDEVAANEVAKPITSGSKYLWHPSIEFKQ